MRYRVLYHTDIESDIKEAKEWYKKQLNGLEKKFSLSVKETIGYITQNPLFFEVKYKQTRIAFTKTFPFGVHYHLNEQTKTITILTVLHTSKDSVKWDRR